MRAAIIVLLAVASLPALAENTLTDQERAFIAREQRAQQARRERAQARCIENRGADCVTDQGLQEWALLERTREDAVLDRISVESPSMSGAGSTSSPYGQGLPSPTGAFGRPLPGQQR